MAPPGLSWAAIASRNASNVSNASRSAVLPSKLPSLNVHEVDATPPTPRVERQQPRVAFISGHIDITPEQFSTHYSAALDAAIRRNDAFVLSNARGVDTLALAYLRSHNVAPSRIAVYLHTPGPNRRVNATPTADKKRKLGAGVEEGYRREGYGVTVVQGYHTERDAAMTEVSDYDILWVRGEAETAALYGSKYRAGRISGTQKNKDRRLAKDKRTIVT